MTAIWMGILVLAAGAAGDKLASQHAAAAGAVTVQRKERAGAGFK